MPTPEETLRAFADSLAVGDAAGAASRFTEDATYDEPPAFAFSGRAALLDFIADFAARHHDVSFEVSRLVVASDGLSAHATWRWAYTRNADGARRVFNGESGITFRDGLIASWLGQSTREA